MPNIQKAQRSMGLLFIPSKMSCIGLRVDAKRADTLVNKQAPRNSRHENKFRNYYKS